MATVVATLHPVRGNHIAAVEFVKISTASLLSNKLRSFLTLLGIIIGIASIISVISIIQGLDRYWKERVSNFGPNAFVVTQYGITTNLQKYLEALRRNRVLFVEDAQAIKQRCRTCEDVAVEAHKSGTVRFAGHTVVDVSIDGMSPNIIDIEPYEVGEGRNLLDSENDHSSFVAFLGAELAEKLFLRIDPIGKTIQIGNHHYKVVGVAKKRGSLFGFSMDNYVKIPINTFQKTYGRRRSINITIKAKSGDLLPQAMDEVRLVLRTRHHLAYHAEDDFGMVSADGVNELYDTLTGVLFSVALFVVGISLVVGGVVIMNIMLVSVVERTKEIGIRKALGARQSDITRQFLIESVMLCCLGGLVGVALAFALSEILSEFTPLPVTFPTWAPALAVALCTAIGIFFGMYPARRAGKLDPIEALHAE